MFDFFLFNHNAMLRKNFGFGVSTRHINLLFYFTVKKAPISRLRLFCIYGIVHFKQDKPKPPDNPFAIIYSLRGR
jgi:hypothetical protein